MKLLLIVQLKIGNPIQFIVHTEDEIIEEVYFVYISMVFPCWVTKIIHYISKYSLGIQILV